MKAPSSTSTSSSSSSSAGSSSSSSSSSSTYSTAAAAKQYIADSRNELASAARESAESKTQAARAAHSRAEAAADTAKARAHAKAGDTAAAKRELADAARDNARAARDTARSKRDALRASRNKVKARANAIKAKTVSLALPGAAGAGWILGGNDGHRGCAAVAVANSLLMVTGIRVGDEDVLALYLAASGGGDCGTSVLAALEAAAEFGLGGVRPASFGPVEVHERDVTHEWLATGLAVQHRPELDALHLGQFEHLDHGAVALLDDYAPVAAGPINGDRGDIGWGDPALILVHPLILDLELHEAQQDQAVWDWEPSPPWGDHAAVLAGDSVITWGREVPVTPGFLSGQVARAWRVEWV